MTVVFIPIFVAHGDSAKADTIEELAGDASISVEAVNSAPLPVTLHTPPHGAGQLKWVVFAWIPQEDPDGDPVTYRLEVDTVSTFDSIDLMVREGITRPYTDSLGLLKVSDGSSGSPLEAPEYSWRIIPVDDSGASPTSGHEVRSFEVSFIDVAPPGYIAGKVTNTSAGVVRDFTVTLSQGLSEPSFTQFTPGYYLGEVSNPDVYLASVTAEDFVSPSSQLAAVDAIAFAGITELDFTLAWTSEVQTLANDLRVQFDTLDTNNDGRLSLVESGLSQADFDTLDVDSGEFITTEELLSIAVGATSVADDVWVNFVEPSVGVGTEVEPFNTLREGAAFVAPGGSLHIAAGETAETFAGLKALDKQMSLTADSPTVRIGQTAPPASPAQRSGFTSRNSR